MKKPPPETNEQTTRRMLINPMTWPQFVLPLVNRKVRDKQGYPDNAILFQDEEYHAGIFVLRLTNMFAPELDAPVVVFTSVDSLIEAGWEVD